MTKDSLNKLSDINLEYLKSLRENITKARGQIEDREQLKAYIEQIKNIARGYIRALVDVGVLEDKDFRCVWSWFTLACLV